MTFILYHVHIFKKLLIISPYPQAPFSLMSKDSESLHSILPRLFLYFFSPEEKSLLRDRDFLLGNFLLPIPIFLLLVSSKIPRTGQKKRTYTGAIRDTLRTLPFRTFKINKKKKKEGTHHLPLKAPLYNPPIKY